MTDQSISTYAEIWPLCGETSQAIYAATRPSVDPLINEIGLTQPHVMHTLLLALAVEPDPISPERIWRRYSYGTVEGWSQPMATLAERQLLEAQGNDAYRLTSGGRAITTRILKEFYAGLARIEKAIEPEYPAASLDRLALLLNKLVTAGLNSPIDLFGLKDSHGLASRSDAKPLARIDQALDDLTAFREDAHLASWQPHHIAGHAWELFTFLWRGEVKNAVEMAEKAVGRGHTREAYQSALGDLIGRGWVRAAGENAYEVTDSGRQVREDAEKLTDEYFFTPWKTLNTAEAMDLKQLLVQLKPVLTQQVEAVPA